MKTREVCLRSRRRGEQLFWNYRIVEVRRWSLWERAWRWVRRRFWDVPPTLAEQMRALFKREA